MSKAMLDKTDEICAKLDALAQRTDIEDMHRSVRAALAAVFVIWVVSLTAAVLIAI